MGVAKSGLRPRPQSRHLETEAPLEPWLAVIGKACLMSNLVPDPKTAEPTKQPAARSVGSRNTVSGPAPTVDTHPLATTERTRRIVAIMSNRGRCETSGDIRDAAAEVIATAIRFATRRGRSLGALPQAIRLQLIQLCEEGHPAAQVVRDWLECKLPEPIAAALAQADGEAAAGRV